MNVDLGRTALNAVRGALIGAAESVPGVSGGTIALMTGVYETLLTSAGHFITGARIAVVDMVRGRGVERSRSDFARVKWAVLIPLGIGMVIALLAMASVMETLVEEHPETMRALFFGLVLASLSVPFRLAAHAPLGGRPDGRWGGKDWALALAGTVAAAVIVSLPGGNLDPSPLVLVPAGAIAVSALALPGLSGSFLLLTMGLYEPTLAAVNDRDLGYLVWFALGLVIGLVSIVKALQFLLEHHRRNTLVVLTGVMAGSLVALWPWQDEDGTTLAPYGDLVAPLVAFVAGFVVVIALLAVESRILTGQQTQIDADESTSLD
ncbi:DUF368 domain-containing protein [Demequina sp. NBRC 110051]|uniref:DUF368 domain-containing protein n=1 Tax=Demequina sp. NBRC 110051 TaxID=1570340 RepID=UPI00117FE3A6|nr:DUF368 domain-containing protein [Demequina sp. NBRC 110051]